MESTRENATNKNLNVSAIDNSEVIDFFSLASSALLKEGILTERDCDAFRISISGHATSRNSRAMLTELADQNDLLTAYITDLIGTDALYATLLSNHMNSHMSRISQQIAHMTEQLIDIAKLYFNRPLDFKSADGKVNSVLASSYFSDMAKDILESLDNISMHAEKALYTVPLTENLSTVHASIFSSLGASKHHSTYHPAKVFRKKLSRIFLSLNDLTNDFVDALIAIDHSSNPSLFEIKVLANIITAKTDEICTLYDTNIGESEFEAQKSALTKSYRALEEQFTQLSRITQNFARLITTDQKRPGLYESEKRLIFLEMSEKGTQPKISSDSIKELENYLVTNNIGIDKLIQQELKTIHQPLAALNLGKIHADSTEIKAGAETQKKSILKMLESMSKKLQLVFQKVAIVIPLLGFLGCGVKGAPQSITEPIRPEVPYGAQTKNKSNKIEKNNKTKQNKQNSKTETK
jgi:hypothetical protein